MVIKIDPSSPMDPLEQRILGRFIEENPDQVVIHEKTTYTSGGTEFELSHDIYRRLQKSGNKFWKKKFWKPAYRYEVMSHDVLAEGGFSEVYPVETTLCLKNGYLCSTGKQKDRIIKVGLFTKNEMDNERRNLLVPHLHAKQPIPYVFQDVTTGKGTTYVASVLKRMPGKDLYDTILPNSGNECLTTEQKLQLALSLLKALKEQVQAQGLVHRDIKPENIMVDFKPGDSSPEVNIIDFGLSKKINEADSRHYVGTFAYTSPEMLQSQEANLFSDIFSMGKVLGLLFSSKPGYTEADEAKLNFLENKLSEGTCLPDEEIVWLTSLLVPEKVSDIFQGRSDISDEHKEELLELIKEMCKFNYSERILLKKAIGVLERVCLERKQERDQLAKKSTIAPVISWKLRFFTTFSACISESENSSKEGAYRPIVRSMP